MTEHEHRWFPYAVGYAAPASNMPAYFFAQLVCGDDDCDEQKTIITKAEEA